MTAQPGLDDLLRLTQEDGDRVLLGQYAGDEGARALCRRAREAAQRTADGLRGDIRRIGMTAFAQREGLRVVRDDGEPDENYTIFASFAAPDRVEINARNADAVDALLRARGWDERLGGVPTFELLLAHEYFHFLEYAQGAFSEHNLLETRGIFGLRTKRRLACLDEAGAMAFAARATGLKCPAFLYNVLMLLPAFPQKAQALYEKYSSLGDQNKE